MNEDLYERIRQFIINIGSFNILGSNGFVNIIIADDKILISINPSKARELGKLLIQEADKVEKVH